MKVIKKFLKCAVVLLLLDNFINNNSLEIMKSVNYASDDRVIMIKNTIGTITDSLLTMSLNLYDTCVNILERNDVTQAFATNSSNPTLTGSSSLLYLIVFCLIIIILFK